MDWRQELLGTQWTRVPWFMHQTSGPELMPNGNVPLLLSLLADPVAHARVVRAAELIGDNCSVHRVCRVGTWEEAYALTLGSVPHALVFDPFMSGSLDVESCARFRAAFSSVAILAYGDFGNRIADDIIQLAQVGVHGVVTRDTDHDPAVLRNLFERVLNHSFVSRVLATLADELIPDLIPLIRHLLEHTTTLISPAEAARASFCSPKTLRERLRRAGLPPTAHLIVWTRLFHAAYLLEDAARTVENVAGVLDFPSAAALGNQLKRYTGLSPANLRRSDPVNLLLGIFLHWCNMHEAETAWQS